MPPLELVTREDVTLFLNACFACTGQREFHDTADGGRVSVAFLHEYVRGNYRRLYARSLAAGVNDFARAEIVYGLLASGRDTPPDFRAEENALVTAGLRSLPSQRAWKLVERLRAGRVNNRRARALLRDFLTGRRDPAFDAVKYRRRVKAAACHAHLALPGELGPFLFGDWRVRKYATPLLETFRRAHYAHEALYELPLAIAEGLAARHRVPREVFLKRIAPRLTERERLRLHDASGGALDVRPERLSLTALCLFVLSRPPDTRTPEHADLLRRAARAALARLGPPPLPPGRVAAVLDNSFSSSGSREKRRRPLGVALGVHALLAALHEQGLHEDGRAEYRPFWTRHEGEAWRVAPRGQTNLSERLLDALEWGADTVVIVSDGVENDPPGVFHALVAAARRFSRAAVLHLNPAFDADTLGVRGLSPLVPTVGLRDAEDLGAALGFARFAAGAADLAELEAYLAGRAAAFLRAQGAPGPGGTP